MTIRLIIACDHGGLELKETLKQALSESNVSLIDLGVHTSGSVDYPDLTHRLADKLTAGEADLGLLICGTGIGVSITANRHRGVRAALCTNSYMAKMSREHNDANVLCLGGRVVGAALGEEIVRTFLSSTFRGGRHSQRVSKIELR